MSTAASAPAFPLRPLSASRLTAAASAPAQTENPRGLAAMLLAAVVAAMVVLADRLISTWADGHLLLAWVFLWVVVFAGMALFAGAARTVALRALRSLDGWSQTIAQARADARLWTMAQSDPRLMQELQLAIQRQRAEEEAEEAAVSIRSDDYSAALAPLGMSHEAATPVRGNGWNRFIDRLAAQRSRHAHMYYI